MRRLLVFFILVCTAGVGAWALPAGQASPTVAAPAAAAEPVVAPVVEEPELSVASASLAPVAEPLEIREFDPVADHLVVDPQDSPEPDVIVTTTTTLLTTTAPTTTLPTTTPVASVSFTASQAYGSCGEDVPYDVFSGMATPGTAVTISSAFGGGTATANGNGHWERTVEFPSAPRGETFAVTASGLGGSTVLYFTATGGPHT